MQSLQCTHIAKLQSEMLVVKHYYNFIFDFHFSFANKHFSDEWYKLRAATVWYFIASTSLLGTPNESAMVPEKWAKGDSHIFFTKCSTIIPPLKEYFPLFIWLRQLTKWGQRQIFGKKGQFPHLPNNRGTRWRMQSKMLKVHHTPNCS